MTAHRNPDHLPGHLCWGGACVALLGASLGLAAQPRAAEVDEWPTDEPCRMAAQLEWSVRVRGAMAVRRTPPGPFKGLKGVAALASDRGWNHCALMAAGTLECWGVVIRGPLGDGDHLGRPGPVEGLTGVAEVAVGEYHACARMLDGSLRCWGSNHKGQLGVPKETRSLGRPGAVAGICDVDQVVAGWAHTCVRNRDGTLRCWGTNDHGQLGDGTRIERHTPQQVSGLHDAVWLAAGTSQVCAIRRGGEVVCWGDNVATLCSEWQPAPIRVPDLAGVRDLAVGSDHACALLADGSVSCWGQNEGGQIGDGTTAKRMRPVPVAGLEKIARIYAGGGHSCALHADGGVSCWGKNQHGQVDGKQGQIRQTRPLRIPRLTKAVGLALAERQTCALRRDGSVWCWGLTTPEQVRESIGALSPGIRKPGGPKRPGQPR